MKGKQDVEKEENKMQIKIENKNEIDKEKKETKEDDIKNKYFYKIKEKEDEQRNLMRYNDENKDSAEKEKKNNKLEKENQIVEKKQMNNIRIKYKPEIKLEKEEKPKIIEKDRFNNLQKEKIDSEEKKIKDESKNIKVIANYVAGIYGISTEKLAEITSKNTTSVFDM